MYIYGWKINIGDGNEEANLPQKSLGGMIQYRLPHIILGDNVSNGCRYGEIMDVSATDGDSGQEKLGRPRIHDNIEENTEVFEDYG